MKPAACACPWCLGTTDEPIDTCDCDGCEAAQTG